MAFEEQVRSAIDRAIAPSINEQCPVKDTGPSVTVSWRKKLTRDAHVGTVGVKCNQSDVIYPSCSACILAQGATVQLEQGFN